MDIFYDFVKNNYDGYKILNYSKKLNSRNIATIASHINKNLDTIFLIKKNTTNYLIFRNLKYPSHMYLFLNGEKVFALEDTNIEPHIQKFDDFLGYKRDKKNIDSNENSSENIEEVDVTEAVDDEELTFDSSKDNERESTNEEKQIVIDKLKKIQDDMAIHLEEMEKAVKEKKSNFEKKMEDNNENIPVDEKNSDI